MGFDSVGGGRPDAPRSCLAGRLARAAPGRPGPFAPWSVRSVTPLSRPPEVRALDWNRRLRVRPASGRA